MLIIKKSPEGPVGRSMIMRGPLAMVILRVCVLLLSAGTGAGVRLLPCGQLTTNLYLDGSEEYLLGCTIFVGEGMLLSISAGANIVALATVSGGAPSIVIEPGGLIHANGTAAKPITFTSLDRETASATQLSTDSQVSSLVAGRRGKWGGLILLGRAPINAPGGVAAIEGLEGRHYGGADPMDSSGVLRYVRVWHAGAVISQDNEINGITFGGVGQRTIVEYCEVAYSLDE